MRVVNISRWAIMLSMIATTCGCHTAHKIFGVDRHADIPCGAIPAPLGTYSCQWQDAQTSRAEADYFVLYPNEWRYGTDEDGTRLGPAGVRRLEQFARRLPHEPFTVVIDRSEDAQLDEARRIAVVSQLYELGLDEAESRVVLGRGEANYLYGLEAPQIGTGFIGTGGVGRGGGRNQGGGLGGLGGFGGNLGGGVGGGLGGFGGGVF
jgi:hypothetical protein